eukprot:scaffold111249_cov63-Phaeocystis_antarctica.AAC.1
MRSYGYYPCVRACICRPVRGRGANHRTERQRVGQRDGAAGSWLALGLGLRVGVRFRDRVRIRLALPWP